MLTGFIGTTGAFSYFRMLQRNLTARAFGTWIWSTPKDSLRMFQTFVLRLRNSSRGIVVLMLLCALEMRGPRAQDVRQLYLLAAATTKHSDKTYPATLYQVSTGKRLRSVREVVTQPEGIRFVRAWGDTIFIVHPNQIATAVSIIHESASSRRRHRF